MSNSSARAQRPRGPRRAPGAPAGPTEVRRAVLDAAAALFAERGVHRVSLRDIAEAANVHRALIGRYVGTRDHLVMTVFDDLSEQLAQEVVAKPLAAQGHGDDTVMGRWVSVATELVIEDRSLVSRSRFNPVLALATTLTAGYGIDEDAARLRAAQIVAAALGWRIFEAYLVEAGQLDDVPIETLHDELARSARRLGATPWPSPPDPPIRPR